MASAHAHLMVAPRAIKVLGRENALDKRVEQAVLLHERRLQSSVGLLVERYLRIAVLLDVVAQKLLLVWRNHNVVEDCNNRPCVLVHIVNGSHGCALLGFVVLLDAHLVEPQSLLRIPFSHHGLEEGRGGWEWKMLHFLHPTKRKVADRGQNSSWRGDGSLLSAVAQSNVADFIADEVEVVDQAEGKGALEMVLWHKLLDYRGRQAAKV